MPHVDALGPVDPDPPCQRLVNVAAIRSTGLSASLGIAARVVELVGALGVKLGPECELEPDPRPVERGPWWRRAAEYRARAPA